MYRQLHTSTVFYICIYTRVHICTCTYTNINTYTNIHTYICLYVHVMCTHTHIHMWIYINTIRAIYKLFTYKFINISNDNLHQVYSMLTRIVWYVIYSILYLDMYKRDILLNYMLSYYIFEFHLLMQFWEILCVKKLIKFLRTRCSHSNGFSTPFLKIKCSFWNPKGHPSCMSSSLL